jgi:AcrR family transcriptional regulator
MAAVKTSNPPPRARTGRGEATVSALVTAAVDCLEELGYQGTTTAEISRRAGVSPGLFVRYWPTKQALLAAAAAHAHREAMAGFEQRIHVLFERAADVRAGLRTVISAIVDLHAEPEMRCLAELAQAARTDRELAAEVSAVTGPIDDFVLRSARRLAPADSLGPEFDNRVRLVLDYARGVAQRTSLLPPSEAAAARADAAEALVSVLGLA